MSSFYFNQNSLSFLAMLLQTLVYTHNGGANVMRGVRLGSLCRASLPVFLELTEPPVDAMLLFVPRSMGRPPMENSTPCL